MWGELETFARDLVFAALLYLIPGNAVLLLAEIRGLRWPRRQFLALCVSLVVVPYSLQVAANLHPLPVGPLPLAALCAGAILVAWILKRRDRRPVISFRAPRPGFSTPQRLEEVLAWLAISGFALVAILPRLHMLLQGSQTPLVAPWDETWHLAQLTSVARTGIPPRHYFFPQLHLAYYYASWIYPAILGNLLPAGVSLARAMALHSGIQVFAFLGLCWLFLRANISDWRVRWLGLAFFTFAGGLDYFASAPVIDTVDWWQSRAAWLASDLQVSQFVTLYLWVPQHLAGGMAFLAAWLLWKDLDATPRIKSGLTGVLMGFCLATSPYVFVGFALAAALFMLGARKSIRADPRGSAICLGILVGFFLISAWGTFGLYRQASAGLEWSSLRLVIVETLRGSVPWAHWADRILTLVAFPVVASALLLIEMGFAFLLYLAWWASRASRTPFLRDPFEFTMALLPPASLLALFLVWSSSGGGNLGMRGLIPAQVLVVFAGLAWLDGLLRVARPTRILAALAVYCAACLIAAQSISAAAELRATSSDSIKLLLGRLRDSPVTAWPDHLAYLRWIEANTPPDALILEEGCPAPEDDRRYRWLERNRLLSVNCARSLALFERDRDFILPAEWDAFSEQAEAEPSTLALYLDSGLPATTPGPVYVAVWQGANVPIQGEGPLYSDPYVSIYQVK
jgi:hypothetical protein